MAAPEHTASCLCGKITLKINCEPKFVNVCYCLNCQKVSGAICPGNAAFASTAIEINDPESLLKTYPDRTAASGELRRSFCSNCGSRIKNQMATNLDVTVVPVGIFDDPERKGLNPQLEFFAKRRPGWFGGFEGAESYAEVPPWMKRE